MGTSFRFRSKRISSNSKALEPIITISICSHMSYYLLNLEELVVAGFMLDFYLASLLFNKQFIYNMSQTHQSQGIYFTQYHIISETLNYKLSLQLSKGQKMQAESSQSQNSNKMIIGSYPYRSTINIPRLLCEYTGLPYSNLFFNPCSWKSYRQSQAQHWLFQQLPFLIDGDIVVTQTFPICEYIAKRSGRFDLLGRNAEDAFVVDSFLWGKDLIQSLLSLVVENKNNPKKLMEDMHNSWIKTIRSQLLEYEKNASSNNFYLGYLTVIDFILYQVFQHFKSIFRKEISLFPKLLMVRERFASLDFVKQFEKSDRHVSEMCPLQFYKKWKMEAMKNGGVQFDPKTKEENL